MTDRRNAQRPALVSGATGNRGNAVARNLLERGFRVREREQVSGGAPALPLEPGKPYQQFDVEEIGVFTAMALGDPDRWIGRGWDLAGDGSTVREIAGTFGRASGREVSYFQVPWDRFRGAMGEGMTATFGWFDEVGFEADIAALRQEYPGLTTLEGYLREHG